MVTDRDIRIQVIATLDGADAQFNVDGIVAAIIDRHGLVDVETIDTDTYWALVEAHDAGEASEEWVTGMVTGYLAASLWTGTDADGQSLDSSYEIGDVTAASWAVAREQCADFADANWATIVGTGMDAGQCGHDFSLTRNRHGAGFWDRGYGAAGDTLTAECRPYGSADVAETGTGWLVIE